MRIVIKDAWGTDVGEAEVTWLVSHFQDQFKLGREVADIFPAVNEVLLPTRNNALTWKLVIFP